MFFNNSSKVVTCTSGTGSYGAVLPYTSKMLCESEIDSKIQKTKGHIAHLSNAQSHKTTHGGKKFRGRQITLRDQIDDSKERLGLLKSAKGAIVKLNNEKAKQEREKIKSKIAFENNSLKALQRTQSETHYWRGRSIYSPYLGGRKITIL